MRNKILKVVNPLIGLLMLNQFLTALFRNSLSFHQFGIIHGLAGFLLFFLIIVHLVLNWNWLKANYFRRAKAANLKTNSVIQ